MEKKPPSNAAERQRMRSRLRAQRERDEMQRLCGSRISKAALKAEFINVVRRNLTLNAFLLELQDYENAVELWDARDKYERGERTNFPEEALQAVSLDDAKARVLNHRLDSQMLAQELRFQFASKEDAFQALGGLEAKFPEPAKSKHVLQSHRPTVADWIASGIDKLIEPVPDAPRFFVSGLGFAGPIYTDGSAQSEGVQTQAGLVSAFAPKARGNEPVQILIGAPGSGKTHHALELMAKDPGRIYAFGPTAGSREQLARLAEKLGLTGRVRVMERMCDLRRRSRVLVDEASLVKPEIIGYARDAREMYLTGDASHSEVKPGESLLGALAALGAPIIELTESRRTSSTTLQLLSQMIGAPSQPTVPTLTRLPWDRSIRVRNNYYDGEFEEIVAASKRQDSIAIVWSEELRLRLKDAGVRAYDANMAQGTEATHVIVHLPRLWANWELTPSVPFRSFLNSICRAREGATIVNSAPLHPSSWDTRIARRHSHLQSLILAGVDEDPRKPRQHPLSKLDDDQWQLCKIISDALSEFDMSADLVRDWLFVYRISGSDHYCGAVLIDRSTHGISPDMVRAAGHSNIEHFNCPPDGNWDTCTEIVRERLDCAREKWSAPIEAEIMTASN